MTSFRSLALASLFAISTGALASPAVLTDGEIKKVDKDASKLTIKHGELKNLEMMPMTMVFKVQDKAMLTKVAAGDKVRFAAEKINGAITVTALEAVK
ncbi:MAG: copper-binding protein [Pseudomonadota bacterium]